jgi:hypothetical protein
MDREVTAPLQPVLAAPSPYIPYNFPLYKQCAFDGGRLFGLRSWFLLIG